MSSRGGERGVHVARAQLALLHHGLAGAHLREVLGEAQEHSGHGDHAELARREQAGEDRGDGRSA